MIKEFMAFLQKYGVIGLAIAVVIGGKVNAFVSATVSDLIMPVVGIFLPQGAWQTWELTLGPLKLAIGHWLGATIDFVIVAYIVFAFTKYILREETSKK
ncbi:MAG: MscL family protein [Bacteroidetes bacterium]|nr:MAG: MscL family protein [Bacteroidota bacterium]